MKKRLFKGVSILGAVLLLANLVLPEFQAFADYSDDTWEWMYVYDEASWDVAVANGGLAKYYETYPDEDRWCAPNAYKNEWHYGQAADKELSGGVWPATCTHAWSGVVNAVGSTLPWIVVNFKDEFKGKIKFSYEGLDDVYPWSRTGRTSSSFGIASPYQEFEEDNFSFLTGGENFNFDISKFNATLVTFRTLTIHYVYSNGEEAAEDFTGEILEGGEYTHDSPEIANYTADLTTVSGTIADDVEITVTYTPNNDTDGNGIADEVEWKLSALPAADGSYTATVSTDGKTITFKNISEKDPGEADNENGHRPAGHIWFGSRFTHPVAITGGATFAGEAVSDEDKAKGYNDIWAGISATKVQELVEAGTLTKSWEIPASYNGTDSETYNIVIDLSNIEVKDTDENENTTLIKVVNGKITVLSGEEIKSSGTSGGGKSSGGGSSATSSNKDKTNVDSTDDTKADESAQDTATADETNAEENNEGNANEEKAPMTEEQAVEKFGQEQIDAYKWALENGITTMKTIEAARLDEPLTRAELAKMMVVYIQKVLEKDPLITGDVTYKDVDESLGDLYGYIKLAYQYQIMGINADGTPIEFFNPNGIVSRGEYATVFSRVLFGDKFNKDGEDFYAKHLDALKTVGILTNTIPTIQEMRGWVMLMMYRSSQNGEAIEKVATATEENKDEPKADEKTATDEEVSDETVSEESNTEENAEATNTPSENDEESTAGDTDETPATEETSETATETTETPADDTTAGDTTSD